MNSMVGNHYCILLLVFFVHFIKKFFAIADKSGLSESSSSDHLNKQLQDLMHYLDQVEWRTVYASLMSKTQLNYA